MFVVHVVVTESFAGTERYVSEVGLETARQGCRVTVVGGCCNRMPAALEPRVEWRPGGTVLAASRQLLRLERPDIVHTHLTKAELAAALVKHRIGARLVTTRHIAAPRGSSVGGRAIAPVLSRRMDRQIAISQYVADRLEARPDAVIVNGVATRPDAFAESSRSVLVAQRFEREKDTITALRAWESAELWRSGWTLRMAGEGAERSSLQRWTVSRGLAGSVQFLGWIPQIDEELRRTGVFLATAPAEPLGLSVLEAMASGVPVVATGAGGHLETVGALPQAKLFQAGDWRRCAGLLSELAGDGQARSDYGTALQNLQRVQFTVSGHVLRLRNSYADALEARS